MHTYSIMSSEDVTNMLTIALIQSKPTINKNANLQKTLAMVEQAARRGAKIICLQELYRTVYFPQYVHAKKDDYAETIPGESTAALSELARRYHVVIIVPIFEKVIEKKQTKTIEQNSQSSKTTNVANNTNDTSANISNIRGDTQYYNSAVVIDVDGTLLGTYHKMHLPQDPYFYEQNYFTAGNTGNGIASQQGGYKVYKTRFATFAVLICYDQWFPEAARIVTLQGADLIFYPTAIGNIINYTHNDGDWHDAWETVMRGHAIANGIHIAAVNRVGEEDNLNFWGQSFVCDAFGKVLHRASQSNEEIVICTVDLAHNMRIRKGWGFLRHRRPTSYGLLAKKQSKD